MVYTDHIDSTTGANNLYLQLDSVLGRGLQALADHYRLHQELLNRYEENIRHSLASILYDNNTGAVDRELDQPWGWGPMIESPDLSVGKLTVYAGHDIPLHDHPGSTGLLLVLQGQVQVRQYKMLDPVNALSSSQLALEQTGAENLATGQITHFGPDQNNIHTLHAVDGDCILFDVLFSPYQIQQRSFFLPVTPQTDKGKVYVSKLFKRNTRSIH
jgi:hypothetical protein